VTGSSAGAVVQPTSVATLTDLREQAVVVSRLFQLYSPPGSSVFMINNKTFDEDRVDVTVLPDTVEEWTVENLDSFMLHSFHVHQQPFQVVTVNGVAVDTIAYQDVVSLPPEAVVVLRIKFPASVAGRFVFHCHVLQHEDAGMMGLIEVLPTGAPVANTTQPPAPTPTPLSTQEHASSSSAFVTQPGALLTVVSAATVLLAWEWAR